MKKLPNIVLQIRQRLGEKTGVLKKSMDCINTEIVARENYDEYLKRQQEPVKSKQQEQEQVKCNQ